MKGIFMMSHNSIGLFTQIDPLAEKYYHISPYAYCAANPVKYLDPDGKNPVLGAVIGAAVEIGSQLIENYDTEKSFMGNLSQNINWTNVAIAAGEGALTSGASAIKGLGAKVAISAGSSAVKEVSNQVKDGAKSYKDIDYLTVADKTFEGAAITAGVGKMSKAITNAKFKNAKATPQNAIKHQRAGQKRYSKSAQSRANQKLKIQKDNYEEKIDNSLKSGANILISFKNR